MRYFPGLLFLGAGAHSRRLMDLLHCRVDDALNISGGLQQSSQGEPEDDAFQHKQEQDLQDAVQDICAALLGREVQFGDRIPYPFDGEPTRIYADLKGK